MLGKICTVCMLVMVSACLVRPSTASKPKLAGIADDVAAVLSKLGAKSTDEAVAKLWAKGDELSDEDVIDLVKLLKSSDGAAALAALQLPVTSKLTKLDNMLAEYKLNIAPAKFRQTMLADMDKTVEEINAAAARYRKITLSIVSDHHITGIKYPARQVLEMAKIQGLAPLKHIELVGTADEVVEANLLIRNFNNLSNYVSLNMAGKWTDNLLAFKKVLTEGNLEKDVFPFYNALIKTGGVEGTAYTEDVVKMISKLDSRSSDRLASELLDIKRYLDWLINGFRKRNTLLKHAGISEGHAAGINKGSLRFLRGAGLDGSETMEKIGISGWAKNSYFLLANKMAKVKKKVASNPEIVELRQTIEKTLKEIEQMP